MLEFQPSIPLMIALAACLVYGYLRETRGSK
jgi:hypothetical protein